MKHPKPWLRIVILLIALLNQLLQASGYGVLPISEEILQELVSVLLTAGAALWVWWKKED